MIESMRDTWIMILVLSLVLQVNREEAIAMHFVKLDSGPLHSCPLLQRQLQPTF